MLGGDYCDKYYYLTWMAIPPKCPSETILMKAGGNIINPGKSPIYGRNLLTIVNKGAVRCAK